MCDGSLLLFFLRNRIDTHIKKHKMCTEKGLTKQIFLDILIKVGLKSRENSEKTRYYFVLLSE